MKKLKFLMIVMLLGSAFAVHAQDEEEKPIDMDMSRPKDIKLANLDSWKNSVFDIYDKVMAEKKKADADGSYDPSEQLKLSTGEIVLLAGKSALMLNEAKNAGKIKQVRAIPVIAKCKKALTHCKRYANSVLGEGSVDIEDDEESEGR